jgi:truncated hemoglobin YjbI
MEADAVKRTKDSAFHFLSQTLGGPHTYSGRPLDQIHSGMQINDCEFDYFVSCFDGALRDHGISEELIAELRKAVDALRGAIVQSTSR